MALYTQFNDAELAHVERAYGIRIRVLEHLKGGVANSSFKLVTEARDEYVMQILDNHNNATAVALADVLVYITNASIPAPTPLMNLAGDYITSVTDRPVLLSEFVAGDCFSILPESFLEQTGEALGRVHQLPPPMHVPGRLRRLPTDVASAVARLEDQSFADWLVEEEKRLRYVTTLKDEQSLIHGDPFADNIIIDHAGNVVFIDWETATIDSRIIDVGMSLVGLCSNAGSFDPKRAERLLIGYGRSSHLYSIETPLLDAASYCALIIGYWRCVRGNPDSTRSYEDMRGLVLSMMQQWPELQKRLSAS